ncbi:MAG: SPOR domain-containing protein, partial [Pseudorhodobacter sp.]|nr:SPOR domain-containing protein [Pseudorhodobacter sp.]
LGLPIATSSITRKGHMLQVVYAGPFASPTQAQSALATTLGAGFTDAILK